MSSFMSVCLNYFKSEGISYYVKDRKVNFPCFMCGAMTIMATDDTTWSCKNGHTGTLATLIRLTEQGQIHSSDGEFFNPYEEKKHLLKAFDELAQRHAELRSELQELRKRVQTLFEHYDRQDG